MSSPRGTVLIDTETASDDAVALIMALRSPQIHVAAITVVAGNVPVEQGNIVRRLLEDNLGWHGGFP